MTDKGKRRKINEILEREEGITMDNDSTLKKPPADSQGSDDNGYDEVSLEDFIGLGIEAQET